MSAESWQAPSRRSESTLERANDRSQLTATWAIVLLAVATITLTVLPYLINHRFYFTDDLQHEYVPMFRHIGEALLQGKWLTLTLDSWLGGNVLMDPQFAIVNPVSLASYAFLARVDDFALGILVLACAYSLVLALGAYWLARVHGATRELSLVAAAAISTLPMVSYWYAHSWLPGLVGTAWSTMAWAAVAAYARGQSRLLPVVLFSWLTLTAGWPHATLTLGTVAGVQIAFLLYEGQLRTATYLVAALSAAAMIAAPAILPTFLTFKIASRPSTISGDGFFASDLGAVLQMSLPSFRAYAKYWVGYALVDVPMYYAAWFILPLAPFLDWRGLQRALAPHRATAAVAGLMLFLPHGPTALGMVLAPIRFLPAFQTAVVILWIALLSSRGLIVSRQRTYWCALVTVIQLVYALQVRPERVLEHIAWTLVLVAGTFAVVRNRDSSPRGWVILLSVTCVVACILHLAVPRNIDIADWGIPGRASAMVRFPRPSPAGYSFFLGDTPGGSLEKMPAYRTEFLTGNEFLFTDSRSVNGYSAVGHLPLQRRFCMIWFSATCLDAVAALFETQKATGKPWVDLMRVDRLILLNGAFVDAFQRHTNGEFKIVKTGEYASWAERTRPVRGSGTVSYVPENATLEVDEATATRERVRLSLHGSVPAPRWIVFARLYWPGYEATINGTAVRVDTIDGILPKIVLPRDVAGSVEVVLSFRPPGLRASWIVAGVGLLVALGAIVLSHRDARAAGRLAVAHRA